MSYNWVDYTSAFKEACKELKVGELVHDGSFGLFEAMSAIEMMDPKMDAGLISHLAARKHQSVDEAIESGQLKMSDFTSRELVCIMDGTLRCLVTWMDGYSLAQTIFVNMYAHKPYDIEDRNLKAFTLGILKLVDVIHEVVQQASVYEEEDFQPLTYGLKLGDEVGDARVGGMLREVEDELNRTVKATRSKGDHEQQQQQEEEQRASNRSALAVHCRVKFVRLLLSSLSQIKAERYGALASVRDHVPKLLDLLHSIKLTGGCGPGDDDDEPVNGIRGFDTMATHRLLPPTFPRYAAVRSRAEALDGLARFVQQLGRLCTVPDVPDLGKVLRFYSDFSGGGGSSEAPGVAARSLLQHAYHRSAAGEKPAFGGHAASEALRETAKAFIAPPALSLQLRSLASTSPAAADDVRAALASFFSAAVRPFGALLSAACHNRARQREKLAAALEELASLQDGADRVDTVVDAALAAAAQPAMAAGHASQQQQRATACFGTWVLYHVINAMVQYVLLGFELELYDTREYCYVFWYLHDVLYAWLSSVLVRAESCITEQQEAAAAAELAGSKGSRSGAGGGGRSKKAGAKKGKRSERHANEHAYVRACQQLCGGYYRLAVALRCLPAAAAGASGSSHRPRCGAYDNEEIRYERRFAAFTVVGTPAFVPYAQFRELVGRCEAAAASCSSLVVELCVGACRSFQQALGLLESLPRDYCKDLDVLVSVAKNNFVATKVLVGEYQRNSVRLPKYEFTAHRDRKSVV